MISFYAEQVKRLKSVVYDNFPNNRAAIVIATVDSFQGSEVDVVIISFVRSNVRNDIGFIDQKRLNVALTRAREFLVCIGNMNLFQTQDRQRTLLNELYNFAVSERIVWNESDDLLGGKSNILYIIS